MSGIDEFDDEAIEALLTGDGAEINGDLAAAVGSVHAAYVSTPPAVGPELAAMIGDVRAPAAARTHRLRGALWPAYAAAASEGAPDTRPRRRFTLRRLAVATVAIFGLTSGLAYANVLPDQVQDAISKVGFPASAEHGKAVSAVARDKSLEGCEHGRAVSAVASGKTKDKPCPHSSSTTSTPTTLESAVPGAANAPAGDNHGKAVSGVANDKTLQGCEHGRAVSAVASDKAKAEDKTNDKPCPKSSTTTTTSTTVPGSTTTTDAQAPGNSGEHQNDDKKPKDVPPGLGKKTTSSVKNDD